MRTRDFVVGCKFSQVLVRLIHHFARSAVIECSLLVGLALITKTKNALRFLAYQWKKIFNSVLGAVYQVVFEII